MEGNILEELERSCKITLSQQQKVSIQETQGPYLLLAVPGSGKTTTLLCRTAYLIKKKLVKEKILSITFSKASADYMHKLFNHLFPRISDRWADFMTIHAFAYRVVMAYAHSRDQGLQLIEGKGVEGVSRYQLLKQIYFDLEGKFLNENDYEKLSNDLSLVKNQLFTLSQINSYPSTIATFHLIYKEYEKIKMKKNWVDFDDLLTKAYDILKREKEILAYYQKKYEYVQIDEGQDTSLLQHKIIELLVQKHRNIFYVADDDQAIYGFRGATPEYLLNLNKIYPEIKILKMEENFRSTGAIVRVTSQLITKNLQRYAKCMYTTNEEGASIGIRQVANGREQANHIGSSLEDEIDYSKIAILYRNNYSAITVIHTLYKKGIPFHVKNLSDKILDHWIIQDILGILQFAEAPRDAVYFSKIYYKLQGHYISKQMVAQINSSYRHLSIGQQIIRSNNLEIYQEEMLKQLDKKWQVLAKLSPKLGIEYVLTTMGYQKFLENKTRESVATMMSYNQFIYILEQVAEEVMTLKELRRKIVYVTKAIGIGTRKKEGVTLSTIHSSKGLEWDQVYLIDLLEGIFPKKYIGMEAVESLEEERRLFYVGMTRAKQELILYAIQAGEPSIFLKEVVDILSPKQEKRTFFNRMMKRKRVCHPIRASIGEEERLPGKGVKISHTTFGEGKVVYCDREKIIIDFGEITKQLNYPYCIENKILGWGN